RQPWRMACAWLTAALGDRPDLPRGLRSRVRDDAWRQVAELAACGTASPVTTSAGRLFDAVAALCGIRAEVNYEGQAAVELEAAADPAEAEAYRLPVEGMEPPPAGRTAPPGDAGLRVLVPEQLPPNDGGIAYGQLAVASARLAAEERSLR